jgi:hypothetical protein
VERSVEDFPFTGHSHKSLFHILYRLRKHGRNIYFTSERFQANRDGC